MYVLRYERESILLLCHSANIGGASRSLATVARELIGADADVTMLTPRGPMCEEFDKLGIDIHYWDSPAVYWAGAPVYSSGNFSFSPGYVMELLKLPVRRLKAANEIERIVVDKGISTIHVNTMVLFALSGMLNEIKRQHEVRIVWHIRELLSDRLPVAIRKRILKGIGSCADAIIAISTNVGRPFTECGRVVVINNEVDRSWLSSGPRYFQTDSTPVVCMTSAFLQGKGIIHFARVAEIVHEQRPDVQFYLFTTSPRCSGRLDELGKRLFQLISPTARWGLAYTWHPKTIQLENNVHMVFDENVSMDTYKGYWIFLNPDECGVSWSRAVIEAMCAGLAVVSTGTNDEFLVDGVTGYLVPDNSIELMSQKILELVDDPICCRQMGMAARERAEQLFSPASYGTKLLDVFGMGS